VKFEDLSLAKGVKGIGFRPTLLADCTLLSIDGSANAAASPCTFAGSGNGGPDGSIFTDLATARIGDTLNMASAGRQDVVPAAGAPNHRSRATPRDVSRRLS
jgi:hypothetical protein